MRITFSGFTAAAILLVAASSALIGKENTLRIVVRGGDLAKGFEIADPAVAGRVNVWGDFIIDRGQGRVEVPGSPQTYEVSFVTARRQPSTYVVRYAVDAANHGYVYIPGKTDDGFRDNAWLIYRGIEGHWFHASADWESLINPLILKARKGR